MSIHLLCVANKYCKILQQHALIGQAVPPSASVQPEWTALRSVPVG